MGHAGLLQGRREQDLLQAALYTQVNSHMIDTGGNLVGVNRDIRYRGDQVLMSSPDVVVLETGVESAV